MLFLLLLVWSDVAIFLLRVALGIVLATHGWGKVKNLAATAGWFDSIGFKPGKFWGTLVAILEFGGGILLLVGFLVQPVALLLVLEFLVIMAWRLKRRDKLVGGYELDLVILTALFALATLGSDFYAIDSFVRFSF